MQIQNINVLDLIYIKPKRPQTTPKRTKTNTWSWETIHPSEYLLRLFLVQGGV